MPMNLGRDDWEISTRSSHSQQPQPEGQVHHDIGAFSSLAWKSSAIFGKVSLIDPLVYRVREEVLVKRKSIYLVFCVLGFLLPYSQFVPWVVTQHGVPMGLFLRELFANRIGGFLGMDVLVSAVVLIFFLRREGKGWASLISGCQGPEHEP